jgi:hypothetical protein
MERAGHVQLQRLEATLAGARLDRLDAGQWAGQDDLPGRVVVREGEAVLGCELLGGRGLAAQQRDHPAAVSLRGFLHQPAAQDDKAQRIFHADGPGRGERRELTQRVTRHRDDVGDLALAPAGHALDEDRGLRVVGAFVDEPERIVPEQLARELDELRADGTGVFGGVRREAPLAWK